MIFYRLTDYFQKTLLMEKRISCILRGLPLRNQNGPQTKIFLIRKVLAVIIKSFMTEQRHSLKTGLKKGTEGAGNIFPLHSERWFSPPAFIAVVFLLPRPRPVLPFYFQV